MFCLSAMVEICCARSASLVVGILVDVCHETCASPVKSHGHRGIWEGKPVANLRWPKVYLVKTSNQSPVETSRFVVLLPGSASPYSAPSLPWE